jgi:hypothetical protein
MIKILLADSSRGDGQGNKGQFRSLCGVDAEGKNRWENDQPGCDSE